MTSGATTTAAASAVTPFSPHWVSSSSVSPSRRRRRLKTRPVNDPVAGLAPIEGAVGVGPRAVHDVGLARLEHREAPLDVVGAHAEVGVDEHAGRTDGGEHASAHRRALALVLGQAHDPRLGQAELAR